MKNILDVDVLNKSWRGGFMSACLALGLGVGCATAPKPVDQEALPDEVGQAGAGKASVGESAVVVAAPPKDTRKISDEDRDDFDKVVARLTEARKAGKLKTECDSLASSFRKVADENPLLHEARHNQAAMLLECGKEADATRLWEELAAGSKPYAPALSSLGYLAWKGGDASKAEQYFTRSISIDKQSGSIGAYLNLAQILRDRARRLSSSKERTELTSQAINYLRSVLAIDGNNLQAYATLCYFYYDLGLSDMAKLVGDQAVNRAQEIATGKYLAESAGDDGDKPGKKGKGKGKAAKEDDAPKASKEVGADGTGYTAEMRKQLGMVFNTLGLVELKRGKISQAIANFKRAIENDAELHEARMNVAALSLKFRDYNTAEENFRAVLKAQPKNYEATIGLGVALRGNKKVDEAEQQYVAAQKLAPQNPDSYFNLGVLYQEYKGVGDKGALQKAQQYYRDYVGKSGPRRKEAERRIKDIDDMFSAIAESEKMQKEAEVMQRQMEEQQKKMEEELRKQQAASGAPAAGAASAPPAAGGAGTAPPPVAGPPVPGTTNEKKKKK